MSGNRGRLIATLGRGRRKGPGALAPGEHSAMRTARLVKTACIEASHLATRVAAGAFTLKEVRADLHVDPQLETRLMERANRIGHKKRCAERIDAAVSVRGIVFRRLVSAIFELIIDRPALVEALKRGARDEDN